MPKASELKKGMVVEIQGVPHIVKHLSLNHPLQEELLHFIKSNSETFKMALK